MLVLNPWRLALLFLVSGVRDPVHAAEIRASAAAAVAIRRGC